VLGVYEVVVCGGGPAGCAAAIAAARLGAKTLLIEKYGYLGGATVAQLVSVVLSTNGVDFQGIWHEWAARLVRQRAMAPLVRSPSRFYPGCEWFRSSVDTEGVKRVWDDLLEDAGADVILSAHFCGACVDDGQATGVIVHTRAGMRLVSAKRVVDATGDAAICHEAGVAWDRGVEGKPWPQQVSLVRRLGGFPAPGAPGGPVPGRTSTMAYRPERIGRIDRLRVDPLDPLAVSAALRDARREIRRQAEALPPGQYLVDTAAELGVRTSRIVAGLKRVSDDDAWECRKSSDGIARASWEIDIHPPDDEPPPERWFHSRSAAYAARTQRIAAGDWFDIPYGCIVAAGVDNLLVAGRCVSAGYLAQGSLRIQQTCMSTGQAAGTAAALSVQAGVTPRELEAQAVVQSLHRQRAAVEPAFAELASDRAGEKRQARTGPSGVSHGGKAA
jgi:glycine/D-amino acid oxidase-like deaminating enzyme